MIIGIGSDLVDIRRVERTLERFGQRFVERVFTPEERARAEACQPAMRAAHLAKRFAAKEAGAKALGTGFAQGVTWRDLSVSADAAGRPRLDLSGAALRRLEEMAPPGMRPRVDLSLSDEYPLAQAFVVLSALPD